MVADLVNIVNQRHKISFLRGNNYENFGND